VKQPVCTRVQDEQSRQWSNLNEKYGKGSPHNNTFTKLSFNLNRRENSGL